MLLFESLYEMLDSYGGCLFLQNSLIAFCVPSVPPSSILMKLSSFIVFLKELWILVHHEKSNLEYLHLILSLDFLVLQALKLVCEIHREEDNIYYYVLIEKYNTRDQTLIEETKWQNYP